MNIDYDLLILFTLFIGGKVTNGLDKFEAFEDLQIYQINDQVSNKLTSCDECLCLNCDVFFSFTMKTACFKSI